MSGPTVLVIPEIALSSLKVLIVSSTPDSTVYVIIVSFDSTVVGVCIVEPTDVALSWAV